MISGGRKGVGSRFNRLPTPFLPPRAARTATGSGGRHIQADGADGNTLVVISNGTTARYYDRGDDGAYQGRFDDPSQLVYDGADDTYTLVDGGGDQIVFSGFGAERPAAQQGEFARYTDADGVTMAVTSYTADGHIAETQRSAVSNGATITESFLYSYLPSGDANAGLLSGVTQRMQVNGASRSAGRPGPTTMGLAGRSCGPELPFRSAAWRCRGCPW